MADVWIFGKASTHLDLLRQLTEQVGGAEWTARYNEASDSYVVDVVEQIGDPDGTKRVINELPGSAINRMSLQQTEDATDYFSRLLPIGAQGATIAKAVWPVLSSTYDGTTERTTLSLGGLPVWTDGALVGRLFRTGGGSFLVVDSARQNVIIVNGDARGYPNGRFTEADGTDLIALADDVAEVFLGRVERPFQAEDVVAYANLAEQTGISADFSDYTAQGVPRGFSSLDGAVVSETADPLRVRYGTAAARVVADTGQGLVTQPIHFDAEAYPYLSVWFAGSIESGAVQLQILDAAGKILPDPQQAILRSPVTRGIAVAGMTPASPIFVRIIAAEANTIFYADALTVTNTGSAHEYQPSMGPLRLWEKAARVMAQKGGITPDHFDGLVLDLATLPDFADTHDTFDLGDRVTVRLSGIQTFETRVVGVEERLGFLGEDETKRITLSRKKDDVRAILTDDERPPGLETVAPDAVSLPTVEATPLQEGDVGFLILNVTDPSQLIQRVEYRTASGRNLRDSDPFIEALPPSQHPADFVQDLGGGEYQFTWNSAPGDGEYLLRVAADDLGGGEGTDTANVTVGPSTGDTDYPDPPVAASQVTDNGDGTYTFTFDEAPEEGFYTLKVSATDGAGLQGEDVAGVQVQNAGTSTAPPAKEGDYILRVPLVNKHTSQIEWRCVLNFGYPPVQGAHTFDLDQNAEGVYQIGFRYSEAVNGIFVDVSCRGDEDTQSFKVIFNDFIHTEETVVGGRQANVTANPSWPLQSGDAFNLIVTAYTGLGATGKPEANPYDETLEAPVLAGTAETEGTLTLLGTPNEVDVLEPTTQDLALNPEFTIGLPDTVRVEESVGSNSFVTGFSGTGFRFDALGEGELSDLIIRNTLFAMEFEIVKLRWSKGPVGITVGGGKISAATPLGGGQFQIVFEVEHGCVVGDKLLAQEVNPGDGAVVTQVRATVLEVVTTKILRVSIDTSGLTFVNPQYGDDLITAASSDPDRDSMLYFDPYIPALDVLDGLTTFADWDARSPEVRLGNLDSAPMMSDGTLPTGAGLYATNVYLEGHMVITGGNIPTEDTLDAIAVHYAADEYTMTDAPAAYTKKPIIAVMEVTVSNNWNPLTGESDIYPDPPLAADQVTDNGDGTFTFDWFTAPDNGAYTIQVTATDANANEDTDSAPITVQQTGGGSTGLAGTVITYWSADDLARQLFQTVGERTFERLTEPGAGDWSPWREIADTVGIGGDVDALQNYIDGAFHDQVVSEAEAAAIEKYLNEVQTGKEQIDARYSELFNNPSLFGTPKTQLQNAKNTFDSEHTALVNAINTAIADGAATPAEADNVDARFAAYHNALDNVAREFEEANLFIVEQKVDTAEQTAKEYAEEYADGKIFEYGTNEYTATTPADQYSPKPPIAVMLVSNDTSWPGSRYGQLYTYWRTSGAAKQIYYPTGSNSNRVFERHTDSGLYPAWSAWRETQDVAGSQQQVDDAMATLGDLAFDDLVEVAKLGTTIIQGGFIRTSLIDVDAITTGVSEAELETLIYNYPSNYRTANQGADTYDPKPSLGAFLVSGDGTWPSSVGNVITYWRTTQDAKQLFFAKGSNQVWERFVYQASYPAWSAWRQTADVDRVLAETVEARNDAAQALGYADFDEWEDEAAAGRTIIKGGLINTNLIITDDLLAENAVVTAQLLMGNGARITNQGDDYLINDDAIHFADTFGGQYQGRLDRRGVRFRADLGIQRVEWNEGDFETEIGSLYAWINDDVRTVVLAAHNGTGAISLLRLNSPGQILLDGSEAIAMESDFVDISLTGSNGVFNINNDVKWRDDLGVFEFSRALVFDPPAPSNGRAYMYLFNAGGTTQIRVRQDDGNVVAIN